MTATYSEIKYFGQLCDKEGAGVGRDTHGSLDPQLILKTTILSEKNELEHWVLVYLTWKSWHQNMRDRNERHSSKLVC